MEKTFLNWTLSEYKEVSEHRYCHNCGKKAVFKDSGLRRVNANGKDLYEFAIYKCENGHTWNKTLSKYKSNKPGTKAIDNTSTKPECKVDFINIASLESNNIKEIEIFLEEAEGKWRLDKLLAQQIEDLSRAKIEKLISCGKIQVNNQIVKLNLIVRKGYTIKIIL